MNPQEAQLGLKKLQAAYPNMSKLDTVAANEYLERIEAMRFEDFDPARKDISGTLKFFPSIAELVEAVDYCKGRRLAWEESQEREKRLALPAAEDRIMDPKDPMHRVIQGPNHQKFLDLLSGKIQLPEPAWVKRKRPGNADVAR